MWSQGRRSPDLRPQTQAQAQTKTLSPAPRPAKRLRSACDSCHRAKMRCSGGVPCASCSDSKQQCRYSVPNRIGRPKGTKNKKTLLHQPTQLQAWRSQISTETEPQQITTDTPIAATPVDGSQRAQPTFASNGLSSFDSIANSASSDPQHLSYSLADSDSPCWDTSYDFMGEIAIDGGQKSPEVVYTLTPPLSEESTNDPLDNNTLPWNGVSSPRGPNTEERSFPQAESRPSSPCTCNCLHEHTQLLCRLKDLDRRGTPTSIDLFLVGTKQVLEPWKILINCHICARNDDPEVLLIAALTMRAVLRRFLGLYANRSNRRGRMTADDNGAATQRSSVRALPEEDVKLTVGTYQVVGEEHVLLTDMLLWNTLRRIKCALACLRERLDYTQMRRRILTPAQPEGDLGYRNLAFEPRTDTDHVQQMMHSFEANVHVLENILDADRRGAKDIG